jgi:hypothetical protein
MVQPAAKVEKEIKGLLVQVLTHRMKIALAGLVDREHGTYFQSYIDHWNREMAQWSEQIAQANQTHLRKHGRSFADEQLHQWEEDPELVEQAIKGAITKYAQVLEERGIKPDKRWLRTILMRPFHE